MKNFIPTRRDIKRQKEDDDIMSLPDQEVLDKNVEELVCENKQSQSKKQEKCKDSLLDGICQDFILRLRRSSCKYKTS